MSQPGSGQEGSTHVLAAAVAAQVSAQLVQPLETRFQAQNTRLVEFEKSNAEFQNQVLAALGAATPRPTEGTVVRRSRQKATPTVPYPDKASLKQMQKVMSRVIKSGCKIDHLKDAQLGLTPEQLDERVRTDPPLPWRPDWLKQTTDPTNKFWVDKILDAALADPKALGLVQDGKIARDYWTNDCLTKHVLQPMWSNTRKEVNKLVSDDAAARGVVNHRNTNRAGRNKRLFNARLKLATGSEKEPRFELKIDGRMRQIPVGLMVEDIMSDVADDEYDSDEIPREVTRDEYRRDRPKFGFEGRPPCFRRAEPWNAIFASMDTITTSKKKGFGLQPRYYAGGVSRGQRSELNLSKALKIPTSNLYRCHISKAWYDVLDTAQRRMIKPSPPGWEVDEERVALTGAGLTGDASSGSNVPTAPTVLASQAAGPAAV